MGVCSVLCRHKKKIYLCQKEHTNQRKESELQHMVFWYAQNPLLGLRYLKPEDEKGVQNSLCKLN